MLRPAAQPGFSATVTSAASGHILEYSGSAWVNTSPLGKYPKVNTYGSGNFIPHSLGNGVALSTGTGYLMAKPLFVSRNLTVDQIAMEVVTGGSAGSELRMGIFNADSDGQPSTLLLDAGAVGSTTNGVKTISISQALTGGSMYYVAMQANTAGCSIRGERYGNNYIIKNTAYPTGDGIIGVEHYSGATTTLPSTFSVWSYKGYCPRVMLRIA